jgi:predicted helicase
MRQSLLQSFQQMYIIDLHGSLKPKEIPPKGIIDQNVFDIMKGTAITILIKKNGLEKQVYFGDVWGRRIEKYKLCAEAGFLELAVKK